MLDDLDGFDAVDRRHIAHDLDLLARYLARDGTRPLPGTRRLRDQLARATPIEARSDPCPAAFRPPIINGVSTQLAAAALGVGVRAVVARLNRGTLRGEQGADRRWLVDLASLPPTVGVSASLGVDGPIGSGRPDMATGAPNPERRTDT